MTIGAAFLGCDPLCDRKHRASKFANTEIAQDLHILEGRAGRRTAGLSRFQRCGHLVRRYLHRHRARIVDLHHPQSSVASLHGFWRRTLATRKKCEDS